MKYRRKPKYKLDIKRVARKKDEDVTLEEFYKQQLRKKTRFKR